MRINTNELEGPSLDWAVAQAENRKDVKKGKGQCYTTHPCERRGYEEYRPHCPSTNWSVGGYLVNRLEMLTRGHNGDIWYAIPICEEVVELSGETPLIATCRAIVAAELGDEIDVPEEYYEHS